MQAVSVKQTPLNPVIRGVEGAIGPGRVTKALQITRALNREDLVDSDRLWIESDGMTVRFKATTRIGIGYATKRDQARKWRFVLWEHPQQGNKKQG